MSIEKKVQEIVQDVLNMKNFKEQLKTEKRIEFAGLKDLSKSEYIGVRIIVERKPRLYE